MTGDKSNRYSWVPGDDHAIDNTSRPTRRQPHATLYPEECDRYQDRSPRVRQETSGDTLSFINRDEFFFDARVYHPIQYGRDTNTQPSRHGILDNTQIFPSPLHVKKRGLQCAVGPHLQQSRQPNARLAEQPCPQRSIESPPQKTIGTQPKHLQLLHHKRIGSPQHSTTPSTQSLPHPRQIPKPVSQQAEQSRPQCTEETRSQRAEEDHIQRTGKARSDQPLPQCAEKQSNPPLIEQPRARGKKQSQIQPTKQSQVSNPEQSRPQQPAQARPTRAEQPQPQYTQKQRLDSHKAQFKTQPPQYPHPQHTQHSSPSHPPQQQPQQPQPFPRPSPLHPLLNNPPNPYTRNEQKAWINSVNTQTRLEAAHLLEASTRATHRESYLRRHGDEPPSPRPQLLRRSSSMTALPCGEARCSSPKTITSHLKGVKRWLKEPVGSSTVWAWK